MNLSERCRPKTWGEVVGQEHILATLERFRQTGGLTGRAYWLSGPSGSGKTTIARLIAAEVAEPILIDEIDGTSVSAAWLDGVDRMMRNRPLFGRAYAFLVNEAHRIRQDMVTRLLVMLDPVPEIAVWVFTTTTEAQTELWDRKLDAAPFLSRCHRFTLERVPAVFAKAAQRIAQREHLDGKPYQSYLNLAYKYDCNLRAMLDAVEQGAMKG